MSGVDVADTVNEVVEEQSQSDDDRKTRFQRTTALLIATIAVLAVIFMANGFLLLAPLP